MKKRIEFGKKKHNMYILSSGEIEALDLLDSLEKEKFDKEMQLERELLKAEDLYYLKEDQVQVMKIEWSTKYGIRYRMGSWDFEH